MLLDDHLRVWLFSPITISHVFQYASSHQCQWHFLWLLSNLDQVWVLISIQLGGNHTNLHSYLVFFNPRRFEILQDLAHSHSRPPYHLWMPQWKNVHQVIKFYSMVYRYKISFRSYTLQIPLQPASKSKRPYIIFL